MLASKGAGWFLKGRGGGGGGQSSSMSHLQKFLSSKHNSPIIFLCIVQRTQLHIKSDCIDDFCITTALSQNGALYAPHLT